MGKPATLTSKCQITIPAHVRRQLGLRPGDRVLVEVEGCRAVIMPIRGSFVERLRGTGKAMWRLAGGADASLSDDRNSWNES